MLWQPRKGDERCEHNTGAVGTVTIGTAVTTSGTASVKGTPAELITSTAFRSTRCVIIATEYAASGVASDGALDILIGAATEEVLIPNLLMGYCPSSNGGQGCKMWEFPLDIPSGSRIAAQAAGLRLSTAFRVAIYLYGGSGYAQGPVGTKVTTYGITTVPNGTTVAPGASGAEGAFTQITASTTEPCIAIVPSMQFTNQTSVANRALALDIGVGAATEEEIMAQIHWHTNSTEYIVGPLNPRPAFKAVPQGSRLAVRMSNSSTNSAGYDVALHCVS